jgi:NAD(P)-dependent dehydrogenase (short-subunit alcohol dehydrogenase family)
MSGEPARVALIAGGSGGIGRAVAARLAADGWRLALAARDAGRLQEAASGLTGLAAPPVLIAGDLATAEGARAAVERTVATSGRLDAVIHAAGANRPGLFLRAKPADFEEVMRANYWSLLHLAQAALGPMRKQRSGAIVAIASLGGRVGREGMSAYCSAKHAAVGLMDVVRRETERLGVRVTTILPGEVDTAMHGDGPEQGARRIPPADVAAAVAFALALDGRTVLPEIELHNRAAERAAE